MSIYIKISKFCNQNSGQVNVVKNERGEYFHQIEDTPDLKRDVYSVWKVTNKNEYDCIHVGFFVIEEDSFVTEGHEWAKMFGVE